MVKFLAFNSSNLLKDDRFLFIITAFFCRPRFLNMARVPARCETVSNTPSAVVAEPAKCIRRKYLFVILVKARRIYDGTHVNNDADSQSKSFCFSTVHV